VPFRPDSILGGSKLLRRARAFRSRYAGSDVARERGGQRAALFEPVAALHDGARAAQPAAMERRACTALADVRSVGRHDGGGQ
jgi:hypothetical protein